MARRGKKRQSDATKVLKGTFQRCRSHAPTVPTLPGVPERPKWLKGLALRVWNEKTAIYAQRGQSVAGLEAALAQYCSLEAELIDGWRRRVEIPIARINAHRIYANEFYDTPASQQGPKQQDTGNPFARNGRRATSPA